MTTAHIAHQGLRALFDKAGAAVAAAKLSLKERISLNVELNGARQELKSKPALMRRLGLLRRINEIRARLQGSALATAAEAQPADPTPDNPAPAVRTPQGHLYEFDPNRKLSQRKRDNAAALALLRQIDAGEVNPSALDDAQKAILAKYSGTGGNLEGADGKKGSAYEYYTPKPMASAIWGLLGELGFAGGRVSDPAAGVGVFGATAPANAVVDAVELNATSGRINALVNNGPGYTTTVSAFEAVAAATPDEVYDAVVTNVPFGEVADRGGNQLKDTKYRREPIQNYFILRSLEKLRPGGLAAFITPPRCVSGKGGKEESLRQRLSYMAEFVGAYRLPNSVFGTAQADTITDVIVLRKYSRETLDKIAELREQSPGVLAQAKVLWDEFISGNYFKTAEGAKHVLGEFVAKDPNKLRDVDRVINTGSVADIAKLLRKFPPSRVDWALLDATETQPTIYNEGDTLHHGGQTLVMKGGAWEALPSDADQSVRFEEALGTLSTPLRAVLAKVEYQAAAQVLEQMQTSGRGFDAPGWLRTALGSVATAPVEQRDGLWRAAAVGLAMDDVMHDAQAEDGPVNYLDEYPELSEAMKRHAGAAREVPATFNRRLKTAMAKIGIHYTRAGGYSAVWRGDVLSQDKPDERTPDQRFEALRYNAGGGGAWVSLDDAKGVLGEEFNPHTSDDWCVSQDGASVCRAADYYVGNYGDFLRRIDADIAGAKSDAVRDKLVRQKLVAQQRVSRLDPASMSFNLASPLVPLEQKAEFVRRFIDPRFAVAYDEQDGTPYIACDIKTPKNERDKLLKRLSEYLRRRTVSLRGAEFNNDKKALEELRRMINEAEQAFGGWVRANPVVMGQIEALANDPERLYFEQADDESPLTVPGLNPEWEVKGFQGAYVRKTAREFSGINGFGVGLGKTSTGLVAVQYAQAIGTKKKTAFVVPSSVLSNWRKEAAKVYASTDDCLFVGLNVKADGSFTVNPADYDRDLTRILENRHSKIFLTFEAFQRLRLKDATAADYDKHLAKVDKAYAESDKNKDNERTKSLREAMIFQLTQDKAKSAAAPFFEDLGIDSLVMDEAHAFKNSRKVNDFKGGKFLSLADPSGRGLDAQAKAWFVRKGNVRNDGVLGLSATPITNSPLEVYSMLSLTMGDQRVNDLMLVEGSDQFMELTCAMENRDEETLDGQIKSYDVFVGLNNAKALRRVIQQGCTIKTAEEVGEQIVAPDAEKTAVAVDLPEGVKATLQDYKGAFRFAIDSLMEKKTVGGSKEAYDRVAEKFGEPMELIGHPFNLINKMAALIADPELDDRATFYRVSAAQQAQVADLVARWEPKAPVEERARPGPMTLVSAVVGTKTIRDGENEVTLVKVKALARVLDDGRLCLDSMDAQTQTAFENMAEKAGVDLDVSVPPKLAALLENIQNEEAHPRGVINGQRTQRVRQLIFCDTLAIHNKIRRLLIKRCGVPAGAIAIITGKVNGKPEEILAVQDGFNADGQDNKYRVVIMNEKGEVGLNLQKGTQAIHHLTTGWTPDSLTQRDGRGVRQGNETETVRVYHYDADGTIDSYKRQLVSNKAGWIDELMAKDGGDSVSIQSGLTREQLEALIDSVGDADAMTKMQQRAAALEEQKRALGTRNKQAVNLATATKQLAFLADNATPAHWYARKACAYAVLLVQSSILQERINNPKASAAAVLRNQATKADIDARLSGMKRDLDASGKVTRKGYGNNVGEAVTLAQVTQDVQRTLKRGEKLEDEMFKSLIGVTYPTFSIEVLDGSAIQQDWQSEVDLARSMVDESKANFKRLAGEAGGMPAVLADKLEAGETAMVDGKPVCTGSFIRKEGELYLVRKSTKGDALVAVGWVLEQGAPITVSVADALGQDAELVLPGMSGYDACLSAAAKVEESLGAVNPDRQSDLYSAMLPEVGERCAKPVALRYSMRDYMLPAPFFPNVIDPAKAVEGARVLRAIVEQQSTIVSDVRDGDYGAGVMFTAQASAGVLRRPAGSMQYRVPVDSLLEFGKARGLKLTWDDAKGVGDKYTQPSVSVFSAMRWGAFRLEDMLKGLGTPSEMENALDQWVQQVFGSSYDLTTDPYYSQGGAVSLVRAVSVSHAAIYAAALKALEVKDEPAAAQGGATGGQTGATGAKAGDEPGDGDMVWINGDTRNWKEQIKMSSQAMGVTARWRKEVLSWSTTYAAWKRLISLYPRAAQSLNMMTSPPPAAAPY